MTDKTQNNEALGQFNLFFEQNKGLIHHTLKEFSYFYNVIKALDYDDLYQEASLAFYKSYLSFDPDKGCAFTTFCVINIRGYVYTYIRDKAHIIRKSNNAIAFERICKKHNIQSITQLKEYEKELTDKNISLTLAEDLLLSYLSHNSVYSLDVTNGEAVNSGSETLGSLLVSSKEASYNFNIPNDIIHILSTLNLSEKENTFVALKALGYSAQNIGEMTGYTRVWVTRVLKGVEDIVRQGVSDYYAKY